MQHSLYVADITSESTFVPRCHYYFFTFFNTVINASHLFLQRMNIFIKFKSGRQFIKLIIFMMTIFCRAHFHAARGRKLFTRATLRHTFLTPWNINANHFQRDYFNTKSVYFMYACEGNGGNNLVNITSSVKSWKVILQKAFALWFIPLDQLYCVFLWY